MVFAQNNGWDDVNNGKYTVVVELFAVAHLVCAM